MEINRENMLTAFEHEALSYCLREQKGLMKEKKKGKFTEIFTLNLGAGFAIGYQEYQYDNDFLLDELRKVKTAEEMEEIESTIKNHGFYNDLDRSLLDLGNEFSNILSALIAVTKDKAEQKELLFKKLDLIISGVPSNFTDIVLNSTNFPKMINAEGRRNLDFVRHTIRRDFRSMFGKYEALRMAREYAYANGLLSLNSRSAETNKKRAYAYNMLGKVGGIFKAYLILKDLGVNALVELNSEQLKTLEAKVLDETQQSAFELYSEFYYIYNNGLFDLLDEKDEVIICQKELLKAVGNLSLINPDNKEDQDLKKQLAKAGYTSDRTGKTYEIDLLDIEFFLENYEGMQQLVTLQGESK